MKEICGFLDTRGGFHKTESECKVADSKIKIEDISKKLNTFEREISWRIFKKTKHFTSEEHVHVKRIEEHIYDSISKYILSNSDVWQNIIKERENLKKELDILKNSKTMNKWWLKFWWW